MDPTLLYKRFKTLVEFGMALQREPSGPLVTHSTRGDMDIWQVLAFEFHADLQQIKGILLPQIKHDAKNTSYIWSKHPPNSYLETRNIPIGKLETPDGEWPRYESWRDTVQGKSSHPRFAAICGFTSMASKLWRPAVIVLAAEQMNHFLDSDDEFLSFGSVRIIRQIREEKTMWIAHEPQKLTRHYVQWPRLAGSHRDTAKLDITALEGFFIDQLTLSAHDSYKSVYGLFMDVNDTEAERYSVDRDFDFIVSRGDLTYPGEPHA